MPLGWDISAASAAQSPGIPASTVPQLDSQITCSSRRLGRRFFPFLSSHLPSPPVFPAVPKPVSYVPSHLCLKFILWGKQVLVKVTPLVSEGAGSLPPSAPVSSEALTETNKQTNKPFVKLRPRGHTFSSNSENSRAKSPKSSEHPDVHSKEKPGSGHEHESSNCYSF